MKNTLIVIAVLVIAATANAEILISVDSVVNPGDITLTPGDMVTIEIWGDGTTAPCDFFFARTLSSAPFFLTGDDKNVYYPDMTVYDTFLEDPLILFGWQTIYLAEVPESATDPYTGTIIDGISFGCTHQGDVELVLLGFDEDFIIFDTQVIHQVPEPATIALFGLSGLLLHRRK